MDVPTFRSTDPEIIAMVRSGEELARRGGHAQKDGRVLGLRWVPTSKAYRSAFPTAAVLIRGFSQTARS